MSTKCLVHGCTNHDDEGIFVGELCTPCHTMLRTGVVGPSNAFFVIRLQNYKRMVDDLSTTIARGPR